MDLRTLKRRKRRAPAMMICWRDGGSRGNHHHMIPVERFCLGSTRRVAGLLVTVASMLGDRLDGAEAVGAVTTSVAQIPVALVLEPVHRAKDGNGVQRLVPQSHLEFEKVRPGAVAFLAICTNEWPAGLAPIFAVEKSNRIELRRRPAVGMESSLEPIFFALPPEDEPDAARLTGRWECRAVRGNGSKDYLAWELAVEGDKVAGRFDPNGEYRVATISGGTFRSNRFELRVEYFRDHYVLIGVRRDGRLNGEWRHTDDSERGTWEATRRPSRMPTGPGLTLVPLYEWRRLSGGACQYRIEGDGAGPEWQRSVRPLCRVWKRVSQAPQ